MMRTNYYIDVLGDGRVRAGFAYQDPGMGPPAPQWESQAQGTVIQVDGLVDWEGPTPTCVLHWADGAFVWIEQAGLDAQRERKINEISQACAAAILAGFVSSALGSAYTYPAKPNDQLNLIGSVAASFYPNVGADWLTPFWCADGAGVWAFRAHTAAQIQQVGVDGKNAILNCMTINERLAAQIMAAGADQLAAIAWPA